MWHSVIDKKAYRLSMTKGGDMSLAKSICISLLILLVITVVNANAVGVVVGPDGKHKASVIQVPFAFYNQSFGAAAGYVWGVGGWPQKQSHLLSTTVAGSTGSAMTFLVGKDLQIPFAQRWFLDPVMSVGYFNDNDSYANGNPDLHQRQTCRQQRFRQR